MAAPELEELWQDPRHWTGLGIYRCAADPRVIVPKRWRWAGWTLNFAHPSAWVVLLGAIAVAVGPVLIVSAMGHRDAMSVWAAVALSVLILCLGAAWESQRRRH